MNNIEINGLCKNYPTFKLNNIGFNVPKGAIMGFVGRNGAGKTTTIKLILSIIRADYGSIKIFGQSASQALNEHIGVVMDAPLYTDDWTARDVQAAVAPFYPKWDRRLFDDYIGRFGLDYKKKVKELSRGMKIKLQLAVALSHNAQLLILDEPTSGLDPVARDQICDLLREFVMDENKSVLFSKHITSDLEKTADYITFIHDGQIIFSGQKDELTQAYTRVMGGPNELSPEQKKLVIGYSQHKTGFDGMVETALVHKLPKTVLTEATDLEGIIIYTGRSDKK